MQSLTIISRLTIITRELDKSFGNLGLWSFTRMNGFRIAPSRMKDCYGAAGGEGAHVVEGHRFGASTCRKRNSVSGVTCTA